MSDNGGSGVNALAIIAILVLVGIAGYWFYYNQNSGTKKIDVTIEAPAVPSTP